MATVLFTIGMPQTEADKSASAVVSNVDAAPSRTIADTLSEPRRMTQSNCHRHAALKDGVWKMVKAGKDLDADVLAQLSDETKIALLHRAVSSCPPGVCFNPAFALQPCN